MSFGEAISECFYNFAVFTGRASQYEFWYWMIFMVLGNSALFILDGLVFPQYVAETVYPLSLCFLTATVVPGLAVGARRLHDIGKNGWWLCILLTGIGYILLIYWWIQEGEPTANVYGKPVSPPTVTKS